MRGGVRRKLRAPFSSGAQFAVQRAHGEIQPRVPRERTAKTRYHAQAIAAPTARRHTIGEPLLDGVDAGIAHAAGLAIDRAMAEPGELHDVFESGGARLLAHLLLALIEQRKAEAPEQLVAAVAREARIESPARMVDEARDQFA